MAVSLVVAIRLVLIKPIKNIIQAMNRLAAGDFTVRLQPVAHGYELPRSGSSKQPSTKRRRSFPARSCCVKDFVNNFSHEFKTPIVSISGFADLLLDEDVTQRSSASTCKSSAMRAGGWHSFPAVCCS